MPDAPAKVILPKPRPEVEPEKVKQPFAVRQKALLRSLRLVFGLTTLLLLAFAYINYELFTVPKTGSDARVFGFGGGDTLVLARYRFWREPRLNDVVFYRAPDSKEDSAMVVGRIMGLPGEKVERHGPTMKVGGRERLAVGFELGPEAKIKDGDVIPEGQYLVLVDDDTYDYGDSRRYGYLPAENIQFRLALNMADMWGKGTVPAK